MRQVLRKRILWVLLGLVGLGALLHFGTVGILEGLGKPLLANPSAGSQAVFDRRGGLLRLSLAPDEKFRLWTPLSEISPDLIRGTLLYEDKSFFSHPGVDLLALVRAFVRTYVLRGNRIGGSTITMQLARLRFALTSRTPIGKLKQILRALQFEFYFSKEQILEAYLNLAPYGENIEGIGAASRIYFGKSAKNLSLQEALALAVVPQNPNRRKPTASSAHVTQARQRLVSSWAESYSSDELKRAELAYPLVASPRRELPFRAPHFVEQVLLNKAEAQIQTSLDPELQEMAERGVRSFIQNTPCSSRLRGEASLRCLAPKTVYRLLCLPSKPQAKRLTFIRTCTAPLLTEYSIPTANFSASLSLIRQR